MILRDLRPGDNVKKIDVGDRALDGLRAFLKKDAHTHHLENVSKTYVVLPAADSDRVVAYITLTCSQIQVDKPPPGLEGYRFPYPAVKIGRLLVDSKYQKKLGLGRRLVEFSIAKVKDNVMPHVGCRFMAVDSTKNAIAFYEKCGFRLLDTDTNKALPSPLMFMDLGKL